MLTDLFLKLQILDHGGKSIHRLNWNTGSKNWDEINRCMNHVYIIR